MNDKPLGTYAQMAAEAKARREAGAEDEKKRRAESKAAYESSGAARQIAKLKDAVPVTDTAPVKPATGSLRGQGKQALMDEEGVKLPALYRKPAAKY